MLKPNMMLWHKCSCCETGGNVSGIPTNTPIPQFQHHVLARWQWCEADDNDGDDRDDVWESAKGLLQANANLCRRHKYA